MPRKKTLKDKLRKYSAAARRMAFMAMHLAIGKVDRVAQWLQDLGCKVEVRDGVIYVRECYGVPGGVMPGDPKTCCAMFGFFLFGPFWPMVDASRDAYEAVDVIWREYVKAKKAKKKQGLVRNVQPT